MLCSINLENSKIDINVENNSAFITGGCFGKIKLLETALFNIRIKNTENSQNININSKSNWENVKFSEQDNIKLFCFENPQNIDDISVFVKAEIKENSISWGVEVVNNNKDFSVMQITYPTPLMTSDFYDLFLPLKSGKVRQNAGKCNIDQAYLYPNHASMQYFGKVYYQAAMGDMENLEKEYDSISDRLSDIEMEVQYEFDLRLFRRGFDGKITACKNWLANSKK